MPPADVAPAHAALDALLSRPAGEVFDALARRALGKPGDLAALLAPVLGATKPQYARIKHNPGGSEAWFRRAERAGLPTFRLGREKVARWEEAERWHEAEIAAQPKPAAKPQTQEDADRASLAAMGVRLRTTKGARR